MVSVICYVVIIMINTANNRSLCLYWDVNWEILLVLCNLRSVLEISAGFSVLRHYQRKNRKRCVITRDVLYAKIARCDD